MNLQLVFINVYAVLAMVICRPSVKEDGARMTMRGFVEGDQGITDWWQTGQDELVSAIDKTLRITQQIAEAKNVILFIGDGMGVSTVTAARIYNAQNRSLVGDDVHLAFERFPHVGLSKVYNTDSQTPDSAATATAYVSGYKAKRGTVGVNQNVYRGNCTNNMDNKVPSFLHTAMEAGKWTGIVTTTRLTHATPAATYAHVGERDWESDRDRNEDITDVTDRESCPDIAWQLVHSTENAGIRVMLGGGRREFLREDQPDPEYPNSMGERQDGHDLTQDWLEKKAELLINDTSKYKFVMNEEQFNEADEDKLEYLMGMFEHGHMQYETERQNEPSLAEMTTKAIKMLQRSDNGFAMLIEGGRIDHAHHDSYSSNAIIETVALSDAVQAAVDLTDESDTLIIVTADHSHVFAMNGYPYISNDILGLVREENDDHTEVEVVAMDDGKPYLTLSYTNGPGFLYHRVDNKSEEGNEISRRDLINDTDIGKAFYQYDTGMYKDSETHGGEDVAIYARGPMSHLIHGVHEQNYIAHLLMYAGCMGPNTDHCDKPNQYPECITNDTTGSKPMYQLTITNVLICLAILFMRFL